ncbi:MAG: class I SAM-dependent methyltransferase [Roseateles sp.]|uniref:class I SAM-dependent methyltransferase n=1 Tax=Roseateles sp. TaxID=1971397 RepID=UPI0040358785
MSDRIEAFVESMKIRPTDRVLEIGCGHGVAASLICAKLRCGLYVAVDRSGKMVEAAAKRNQAFVNAGIAQFLQSTLESLDLGEQRFNKVLAMRVRIFHDQPDLAKDLARRWLVPRGQLFVQYDEPEAQ